MSDFSLDLVTMHAWRKNMMPFQGNSLDHTNLKNIVIMQTGGDQCIYPEECINRLRTMQVIHIITISLIYKKKVLIFLY